jgi:uncharacterized coiled-coil protein SlyX
MEVQANMARFENEKKAAEQEVTRSRDLRVQVATFSQTETELRSQLNVYVEKFKQVSQWCLSLCSFRFCLPKDACFVRSRRM